MKKIFKNITISLLAAASLYGVNGCNKFLDVLSFATICTKKSLSAA